MNIYELLNRFWLENEYDPCSATEIALYFFLLNKANTRRWKMPFRCSTELIRMQLSTTRQNVLKAREGLHKKGFISFTTGTSKGNYAQYSIIEKYNISLINIQYLHLHKYSDAILYHFTNTSNMIC